MARAIRRVALLVGGLAAAVDCSRFPKAQTALSRPGDQAAREQYREATKVHSNTGMSLNEGGEAEVKRYARIEVGRCEIAWREPR